VTQLSAECRLLTAPRSAHQLGALDSDRVLPQRRDLVSPHASLKASVPPSLHQGASSVPSFLAVLPLSCFSLPIASNGDSPDEPGVGEEDQTGREVVPPHIFYALRYKAQSLLTTL